MAMPSAKVMTVAEPVFFIVRPVTVAAAGVVAPMVTPSIEPAVRVRVLATSSSAQGLAVLSQSPAMTEAAFNIAIEPPSERSLDETRDPFMYRLVVLVAPETLSLYVPVDVVPIPTLSDAVMRATPVPPSVQPPADTGVIAST